MPERTLDCDVAIVGGGPAGLAAAIELARAGVGRVLVLDREREAGGIPRHCAHSPYGLREFGRLMVGPAYARRLVAEARAAGAEVMTGATVTALKPGPRLQVSTDEGLAEVTARRVLLATGVRETSRAARLIGGVKPGGVLSTGALQGLVHLEGLKPFRRPVILGTELVAFSALLTCRQAGIRPAAMVEPGDRPTARWPAALLPRLLGVPLHLCTDVVAVEGDARVEAIVLADAAGKRTRIPADGLIVTGRFVPEAALVRDSALALDPRSGGPVIDQFGRCSDPAYFAAGNLLRPVETAGWSFAEGRRAGAAIAADLAGHLPDPASAIGLDIEGDPLKYAVPQRLVAPWTASKLAHGGIQLRLRRAARGQLILTCGGRAVWSRRIDSLPERRIILPLDGVPSAPDGPLVLRLEEDPA